MPSAVETSFDVAFWLLDQALDNNEYLQPQKLHRLLFLSQAYFSVVYKGRKLMPAVFVANEMGPIEPNIYRAFVNGRPSIETILTMPPDVDEFLKNIWRRFGHHSVEHLNRICNRNLAYVAAFKRAPGTEITVKAMAKAFTRDEVPAAAQVVRPKTMRTQGGLSVSVSAWQPKEAAGRKPKPKPAGRAAIAAKVRKASPDQERPMIVRSQKKPMSAKELLIRETLKKRGM